jgi:DNA replication protein DnaC
VTKVFDTPTDWKSTNWWRNRSLDERLFHAKIPSRYADHPAGSPFPSTVDLLRTYERGKDYLFCGPSGSGKTTIAISLMYGILTMPDAKYSARFVDADDYVEMIKDSFSTADGKLSYEYSSPYLLKYIKGVWDVLILDGLGNERQTEFARHEIGSLLRHRYDHKLTTIITSTMGLTDIIAKYGDRVSSPVIAMKQVNCAR